MRNYDNHPYVRTLRFFEAYYPFDTEKVNYAELMLSMDKLSNIDELFSTRNRILDKYFDSSIVSLKLPKDVCQPLDVGSGCMPTIKMSYNREKDINGCFNANIIRLFKDSKEPTLLFCGECIVNMSKESANYEKKIKEIVQYAWDVYGIDAEELSKELRSRKESLHKKRINLDKYKEGMNGYLSAKQEVQEDFDFLMKYKWRLTDFEKKRYIDFLPQKMRIQTEKKKDATPVWVYVLTGVIVVGLVILIAPIIDVLIPWLLVLLFILWCFSR